LPVSEAASSEPAAPPSAPGAAASNVPDGTQQTNSPPAPSRLPEGVQTPSDAERTNNPVLRENSTAVPDGIVAGNGSASPEDPVTNSDSGGGRDTGQTGLPWIELKREDVLLDPANQMLANQSVTVTIRVRNKGAVAPDLSAVLMGPAGTILATSKQFSLAARSRQVVSIQWTPDSAKTNYAISVIIYDASQSPLARVSLRPVSIRGRGEGTPNGGEPWVVVARQVPFVVNWFGSPQNAALPFGLPEIELVALRDPLKGLIADETFSMTVRLVNPFATLLAASQVTLVLDGKEAQTLTVPAIPAKQTRSLTFEKLIFSQSGQHTVELRVERGGAKPLKGSIAMSLRVGARQPNSPAGTNHSSGHFNPHLRQRIGTNSRPILWR